jgi:hypothetical protein
MNTMRVNLRNVAAALLCAGLAVFAQTPPAGSKPAQAAPESGYRIDEPGTITFTVGVTIKGKVEKPQVVIFLPKEKPFYRDISFSHSFAGDLLKPLPFAPVDVGGK